MSTVRLEIDLDKISANAAKLVGRLGRRNISVMGVTKVALGCPAIARSLLEAGVCSLGDSRIENIQRMRATLGPDPQMTLIRSPMLSQAENVVRSADISFNTELVVINQLSLAAEAMGRTHGVVLMVELGDLREGIMPDDLDEIVCAILSMPNIILMGIGTNLACLSGASPDETNMAVLSALARRVEQKFDIALKIVSGGNSANIDWAFAASDTDRINNLRLGEAILLGREALHRTPIEGLSLDAFSLLAEVIEAKIKPTQPWGVIAQNAFGEIGHKTDCGNTTRVILALGRQDCDPAELDPPKGTAILGASSDHLVLDTGDNSVAIGDLQRFGIGYKTLLRAMMSPFVKKVVLSDSAQQPVKANSIPSYPVAMSNPAI